MMMMTMMIETNGSLVDVIVIAELVMSEQASDEKNVVIYFILC